MLYVLRASSFISTQFFVLNLVGWFDLLCNKFIIFWYFIIILLYYSQIINDFLSFFWRYIPFFKCFFITFICNCSWIILLWSFRDFRNLSAILVVSLVFWITLFIVVLSAYVVKCVKNFFGCIYHLRFDLYLYQYPYPYFLKRTKIHSLLQIFDL